ncbi:MAG TPA: DMT family transporter [Thermoanaerobaculia bacterium]|nr:DMT family transporter [Thermoanaerobaculia bacterium]
MKRGVLLVLGAALLWSAGGVCIKAIDEAPLKIAFYRSAFAAAALLLYFRPRVWKASPAFLVAIASYAACLTTFVLATRWTSAANAIFLQYSGVVWVMLLSPLVLREPLKPRDAAAVFIALCGMALFFVGKFEAGGRGLAMGVLTSVLFAALILSLRSERGLAAEAAVTWGNVLAAAALFPFVRNDLALSPKSAAVLVFLGVVQIAGAYALFVEGLKHVTATQASLAGMLEPIANPVWVFLVLGERPSAWAIAGGAIVLAAIGWRTLSAPAMPELAPPD